MTDRPARTVVVTGSASGIGAATAAQLRHLGDRVIGVDLRSAEVVADLSTAAGRAHAIDEITSQSGGRVDAMVGSAGVSSGTALDIAVNYFGAVAVAEGLLPLLAQSDAARGVLIASESVAKRGDDDLIAACLSGDEAAALRRAEELAAAGKGTMLYPSGKIALTQWMRTQAISDAWAGQGIALNAVGPGVVVTPMTDGLRAMEGGEELLKAAVPSRFGGWMGPEVVADACLWLTRPENTHITAQLLFVDGGSEAVQRGPTAY